LPGTELSSTIHYVGHIPSQIYSFSGDHVFMLWVHNLVGYGLNKMYDSCLIGM